MRVGGRDQLHGLDLFRGLSNAFALVHLVSAKAGAVVFARGNGDPVVPHRAC